MHFRIAMLAGAHSIHTVRWANGLANRGHSIHLISLHEKGIHEIQSNVELHILPYPDPIGYFRNKAPLRSLLRKISPQLLHVHYASGYGTLGRLSKYRPLVLSVWGADVYDFPRKNKLFRTLVRRNLLRADLLTSTSKVMAEQVRRLLGGVRKELDVVPFGVDINQFSPGIKSNGSDDPIVIGTVKTLADKYGIDTLLHAYSIARKMVEVPTRLLIVGGGPKEHELKRLAVELDIENECEFVGAVPHQEVPNWLRKLDIYCALSRFDSESFGVAIIEASACGLPVIVSDAGGLPEVVINGVTGYVVPRENPKAAAEKMAALVNDAQLRQVIGAAGREHVCRNYSWEYSLELMEHSYAKLLKIYEGKSAV